jgi:dihydroxyacetone kinase-like predicted kinase
VPPSRPEPSLVRFRAAVEGALAHLESRRAEINDLKRLFPVADGDTGDNMALTLRACLDEVDRLARAEGEHTIDEIGRDEIVDTVARAALLGARGNSGVILSQLIRGAAEELISRPGELVDPVLVGAAMARSAQRAYDSVRAPAEGTMLTVMRDMATSVAERARAHARTRPRRRGRRRRPEPPDRRRPRARGRGRRGVAAPRPDLLPVLREAGVVDAGGYGVIVILAGASRPCAATRAPTSRTTRPRASASRSTPRRRSAGARTSPSPAAASRRRPSSRARGDRRLGASVVGDRTR